MNDQNEVRYQVIVEATSLLEEGNLQQAFEMYCFIVGGDIRVCEAMDIFHSRFCAAYKNRVAPESDHSDDDDTAHGPFLSYEDTQNDLDRMLNN